MITWNGKNKMKRKEKKRKGRPKEKKRKSMQKEKKRKTTKIKKLELEIEYLKKRVTNIEKKNSKYRKFIDWLQN